MHCTQGDTEMRKLLPGILASVVVLLASNGSVLGLLTPSADAVARALAGRQDGWRVLP